MTHRGPFQPLLFCDSVISIILLTSIGKAYGLKTLEDSSEDEKRGI